MGTRFWEILALTTPPDHPHAYGDKIGAPFRALTFLGSSPRVWGQGNVSFPENTKAGIIPTRMGTSDYSAATNTGD